MYVYESQYGWNLQPKTNSPIPFVKYWDDFRRVYQTRAEAQAKMSEIWKAESK